MKTLIIYKSIHHGNTEKVAKVMATALSADLLEVEQVDVNVLAKYDLIGFGSGIYFGRHDKSLLELVDKLPVLKNKKTFTFATSGLRKMRFIHDFDIIGEFSCSGFDTYGISKIIGGINKGRPNEKDLNQVANFARGLKDRK